MARAFTEGGARIGRAARLPGALSPPPPCPARASRLARAPRAPAGRRRSPPASMPMARAPKKSAQEPKVEASSPLPRLAPGRGALTVRTRPQGAHANTRWRLWPSCGALHSAGVDERSRLNISLRFGAAAYPVETPPSPPALESAAQGVALEARAWPEPSERAWPEPSQEAAPSWVGPPSSRVCLRRHLEALLVLLASPEPLELPQAADAALRPSWP